jgi:uncharacterized Zn finger protein (UPF0148 family)
MSENSKNTKDAGGVKKMAEALRLGATMLAEPCPNCASPLFRFRSGEVKCVSCDTVVSPVAKPPEAQPQTTPSAAFPPLEKRVLELLSQYGKRLETADGQEAEKLLAQVDACLTVLVKIRDLGKGTRGAS